MVSTSAWKAGDPWFDSQSGHNQFCASVSICLYIRCIYIYITKRCKECWHYIIHNEK